MKTKMKNRLTGISGAMLVIALFLYLFGVSELGKDIILITAALLAGYPIFIKAISQLKMKMVSIELLVSIAVMGALLIEEYTEAAVVSFLFLFGAYLEIRTLEKARTSLKSLTDLQPTMALVSRDGEELTLPIGEVQVGEHIIVKSGGKIPVDGKILKGEAEVEEAAITGESMPVKKGRDDKVFSGTFLNHGFLLVEAEKVGEETTFSQILDLVEEAQEKKAKSQRFLERFATYYTSGVVLLAFLVFLFTFDIHLSLTFLVIACPGALVISAPVSIVAGIGKAAKNGLLIKGGEVIEKLSKTNGVVFDKTGTLTEGKPSITKIHSIGMPKNQLLELVARVEVSSEHHIARAVVEKAGDLNLNLGGTVSEFKTRPGLGVEAMIEGKHIIVGNSKLLQQNFIPISKADKENISQTEREGNTVILAASDNKFIGWIGIADKIRDSAYVGIQRLKEMGIAHIVMLTGDNHGEAKRVGDALGMEQQKFELMPQDKLSSIESCKKKKLHLAMVGDGINDAPALAAADLGIAIGGSSTDIAMETADAVIMSGDLRKLSYGIELAQATLSNMRQNMYFSLSVVTTLLLGVLIGDIHLASGMLIHEASVILVILNAIRLVYYPKYHLSVSGFVKKLQSLTRKWNLTSKLNEYEINGCRTYSVEEFKKCSVC